MTKPIEQLKKEAIEGNTMVTQIRQAERQRIKKMIANLDDILTNFDTENCTSAELMDKIIAWRAEILNYLESHDK